MCDIYSSKQNKEREKYGNRMKRRVKEKEKNLAHSSKEKNNSINYDGMEIKRERE